MKTSDFSYNKVTNLRDPSNSLLFFKKKLRGPVCKFSKKLGGAWAPQAPMDGTPMIESSLTCLEEHNYAMRDTFSELFSSAKLIAIIRLNNPTLTDSDAIPSQLAGLS